MSNREDERYERVVTRKEVWRKKCRCKSSFIPDEYESCDACLIRQFGPRMLPAVTGGCCHDSSYGYTSAQVAALLRRALGGPVVWINKAEGNERPF